MNAPIGTRVKIRHTMAVGQAAAGRWGEIVEGPRKMLGSVKYQVRIDLQGRETAQRTVWLPAASLLVRKSTKESA